MRAFRFPSRWNSASLLKHGGYHPLADLDERDYTTSHDSREDLSRLKLVALTCSAGGLQIVLSLIMSNGTPYLITLGLHESLTAVVWIVAPLSGAIIQPYVGLLSDRCQSRLGRRRPFIIGGAIGCVLCMLALASARTIVHALAAFFMVDPASAVAQGTTLASAILCLLGLYIFIQPMQAGIRSLIVETCPMHQQAIASAWASRLTGVGNIIGYSFGFVPVRTILPGIRIHQFAWLCLVASVLLTTTVIITCCCIEEPDPRILPLPESESLSLISTFRYIIWSMRTMPTTIQRVCMVQFFAWMGWFPYLFYISSYVGDLYAAPLLAKTSSVTHQALVIEDAIRLGSLASLIFSIFALATNMLMPMLIQDTYPAKSSPVPHPFRRISMTQAWSLAHLFFSVTLLTTLIPQSQITATIIAALIGIPWAFTLWVPFALIGREIAARQEGNFKVLEGQSEMEPMQQDQAGTIMGLHNVAISAPQIVAAFMCGTIFWGFPKVGISDSIGWVLRAGSVGGLIASWLAWKMDV